jgi:hypothetical protein
MWIPVAPSPQKTKDGHTLTSNAVARLLALWSQSSFGLLSLMFERQEIEGAWSEWLTDAVRERLVLNPRKLKKKQVTSLLEAFSKVKDVKWDTVIGQFSGSAPSSKYREEIDDCIVENLLKKKTNKLPEFRQQIAHEIQLLGQLMKPSKRSASGERTIQTTL